MNTYLETIEKLNSKEIVHNISPILRKPFKMILCSAIDLYGNYIDPNKLIEKITRFPILAKSKDVVEDLEYLSGFWDARFEKKNGLWQLNGEFIIDKDEEEINIFHILGHEFCHYISQNLHPCDSTWKEIKNQNCDKVYTRVGLSVFDSSGENFGDGDDLGIGINEGMTEYIAQRIVDNCKNIYNDNIYYNYLFKQDYKVNNDYKFQYEVSRRLHKYMGDILLNAYFNGNPKIIKDKFDKILGEGSWKSLSKALDTITVARIEGDRSSQFSDLKIQSKSILNEYYLKVKEESQKNELFGTYRLLRKIEKKYINNSKSNELLVSHINKIFESSLDIFKEYIDINNLIKKLYNCPIELHTCDTDISLKKNPKQAGYWIPNFVQNDIGEYKLEGRLVVKKDKDIDLVAFRACHEICHYLSQNFKPLKIKNKIFVRTGLFVGDNDDLENKFSKDNIGWAINEGMTEYITEKIINKYKIYGKYEVSKEYKYSYFMAKKLHKILGNIIIKSYLNGDPIAVKKQFNLILGNGMWEKFNRLLNLVTISEVTNQKVKDAQLIKLILNNILNEYSKIVEEKSKKSDDLIKTF